jgi:hypothetical protein
MFSSANPVQFRGKWISLKFITVTGTVIGVASYNTILLELMENVFRWQRGFGHLMNKH